MKLRNLILKLCSGVKSEDHVKLLNDYNDLFGANTKLKEDKEYWFSSYCNIQKQIFVEQKEITELKQLFNDGWNNPYGFKNKEQTFYTYNKGDLKLRIPMNTFITPQDRTLRQLVSKYKLKKDNIHDTALAIEKFVFDNIKYVHDDQNDWHPGWIEYFQTGSFTWATRQGDCDDMAILFNTLMDICGYSNRCITIGGKVIGVDGINYGHCYNSIYTDNDEWMIFDSQAGIINRNKVRYPEMEKTWFIFNKFGVYKW